MTPLRIESVSKDYKKTMGALKEVSFELNQGEIFGLIGLNGAGKTTLIKSILDLIQTTKGSIQCFGYDSKNPAARKNLSYLPEKFQPQRYLTGVEYLKMVVSYYQQAFDLEKAKNMATQLHLRADAITSKIGSYSKGMGQKIGLMGAFLANTPLYILDEPMSGLDPKARIALKDILIAEKQAGHTIFFSSHILSDIDEICDRIGVIHHGKLLYVGTPADFKYQYGSDSLEKAFLKAIDAVDAQAA
jgi:ABC-2 type transport system ATP-binding protein